MVEPKEVKPEKPEQISKEGKKEKIKKEKLIKKLFNKEFYLDHKRLFVFLIIGLLLVIGIYYGCDKMQDSASEEQPTETIKDKNGAEAVPPEGEISEEGEEGVKEEKEEGLPKEGGEKEESSEEGEGEGDEEEEESGEGEEGGADGGEEEEWTYTPGPNDYLFESVGAEKIIESVRIRLNSVKSSTPKDFVLLEVGDVLREKIELGETRAVEGLSITLLEAHPGGTPQESYAKIRVEKS